MNVAGAAVNRVNDQRLNVLNHRLGISGERHKIRIVSVNIIVRVFQVDEVLDVFVQAGHDHVAVFDSLADLRFRRNNTGDLITGFQTDRIDG
jgi:hypothetical protein